jgi:8-oxo-dGTP pyrophosphatase MutT (NUDIX family)
MNRHTNIVAAYLILRDDNNILLLERKNTGYHDGEYSLVAGHVDKGETFTECIIRESLEEAGIRLKSDQLKVVHLMHRKSKTDKSERVDVFFEASQWKGNIVNKEPNKCDNLSWFSLEDLPQNIVPCVKYAIEQSLQGNHYSEYGWE